MSELEPQPSESLSVQEVFDVIEEKLLGDYIQQDNYDFIREQAEIDETIEADDIIGSIFTEFTVNGYEESEIEQILVDVGLLEA